MNTSLRRVVFLCFGDPDSNMRILRAASAAKEAGYEIYAVGCADQNSGLPKAKNAAFTRSGVKLVKTDMPPFIWRFRSGLIGALSRVLRFSAAQRLLLQCLPYHRRYQTCVADRLKRLDAQRRLSENDVIFVEHWQAGHAARLAKMRYGCRIIYDLSELSVVEFSQNTLWNALMPKLIQNAEAASVSVADTVLSVTPVAEAYFKDYYSNKVDYRFVPNLVLKDAQAFKPAPKERAGRVVYIGGIRAHRGLEGMIEALIYLPPEVQFDCRGYGKPAYLDILTTLADRLGVAERFHLLPAVAPDDILDHIAGYSCGLAMLDPAGLQLQLAQPNKVFLYLKARVPFVVSGNTTLAAQIKTHSFARAVEWGCAKKLAQEITQVMALKTKVPAAAYDRFLQEIEAQDFNAYFQKTG
ncbi:MAG: glycosyltransferase [Rhodobacterales bacterium]